MIKKLLPLAILLLLAGSAAGQYPNTQAGNSCVNIAVAGGTADALTIPTLPCTPTSALLVLTTPFANATTTPTISQNGAAPQTILASNGTALTANSLGAGGRSLLTYNGLNWFLLTFQTTSGGGITLGTTSIPQGGTATTVSGLTLSGPTLSGTFTGNVTGSGALVEGTGPTISNVNLTGIPFGSISAVVTNNAALKAVTIGGLSVGQSIYRQGFTSAGDGGGLLYTLSGSNCSAADNGSQVQPTVGTGCWLGVVPDSGLDPKVFGAACSGGDDSVAVQNWLNLGTKFPLTGGLYTCSFATPLVLASAANLTIKGPTPYGFTLQYIGASTTVDIITIGNSSSDSFGMTLSGFRCASATTMTAGACIHFKRVGFARMNNIIADGQEGNGNLFNGIWFDNAQQINLSDFMLSGTNDDVEMSGTTYCNSITLVNGKASPTNTFNSVSGVHVGGGCGGIIIGDGALVLGNGINLLVDHTLAAVGNTQIFVTPGAIIDINLTGGGGTDGVQINDSLAVAGTARIELNGWIESASRYGVNVINWAGNIVINASHIGNDKNSCLFVQTTTPVILVGGGTLIENCGTGGSGPAIDASLTAGNVISHATFGVNAHGAVGANLATSAIDYAIPWTITPTCGSGSLTTSTVNSNLALSVGKRVTFNFSITLNAVNTCGSFLAVNLPFTTSAASTAVCHESGVTNKAMTALILPGATVADIELYDGTFSPANGWILNCLGFADHT